MKTRMMIQDTTGNDKAHEMVETERGVREEWKQPSSNKNSKIRWMMIQRSILSLLQDHPWHEVLPLYPTQTLLLTLDSESAKNSHTSPTRTSTQNNKSIPSSPPIMSPFPTNESTYEAVWHKFQLDEWDVCNVYQDQDTKQMVHVAPNKYRFPSRTAFEQCLQKECGWQQAKSRQRRPLQKNKGTLPQQQPQQKGMQASTKAAFYSPLAKRRRRDSHNSQTPSSSTAAATTSTTEKARVIQFYFEKYLRWTQDKPPRNLQQLYNWMYYRPGFNMKNHGLLGQDHFLSGNDLLEYCLKNTIKLPSTSTTHPSPSEKQSYTDSNPEQSDSICDDQDEMETDDDDEEEGSLDTFVRDDDSGYETPTGQTPTLPDPGKPLDREPTDVRNKDDSQDPYDWNILWKRWEHRQAANILENWWYYCITNMSVL